MRPGGPDPGKIIQLYTDTTTGLGNRIRYKESPDGLLFTPTPSLDTLMSEVTNGANGRAPEIAYFPIEDRWMGAVQNLAGNDPILARVIQAKERGDLFGPWESVVEIVTAAEIHLLPSIAKNEGSTLYVDTDGWGYAFFTEGNHPLNPPGINTWRISQARFQMFPAETGELIYDTFRSIGQNRKPNDQVDGTGAEVGGRQWQALSSVYFDAGNSVTGDQSAGPDAVAMVAFESANLRNPVSTLEVDVDVAGSDWVAAGYSATQFGLVSGQIWILLQNLPRQVFVFADDINHVLTVFPMTEIKPGFTTLRLEYNLVENTVSAAVQGERLLEDFDLDTLLFTPDIHFAGFQMRDASAGQTRVDRFILNRHAAIFDDGFETGDVDRWSSATVNP